MPDHLDEQGSVGFETRGDVVPFAFGRAGEGPEKAKLIFAHAQEEFASNLTRTLAAWLRTDVQVSLSACEEKTSLDFLTAVPAHDFLYAMTTEPIGTTGIVSLDVEMAALLVHRLLGGSGEASVSRTLTQVDSAVLNAVLHLVLNELNRVWQPRGLLFHPGRDASQDAIRSAGSAIDGMLCQQFSLQLEQAKGSLTIALSVGVLSAISRGPKKLMLPRRASAARTRAQMETLLGEAKVRVALRLPQTRIAAARLRSLSVGQVLELPLVRYSAAEFLIAGRHLCQAVPVGQGDHRAALLKAPEAQTTSAA